MSGRNNRFNQAPVKRKQYTRKNPQLNKISLIIITAIVLLFIALAVIGVLTLREYNHVNSYHFGTGGGGGGYSGSSGAERPGSDDGAHDDVLKYIAGINGGVLPEITYSENGPIFIDGKYSEVVVKDGDTAIMSVNEIKTLLGMKNPSTEYSACETYEWDGSIIYKFRQIVNGVPVYGKELLIETDINGTTKGLCVDYDKDINISTASSISQPDITTPCVAGTGHSKVYESELMIYDNASEPKLVWRVDVGSDRSPEKRLFVSAESGEIICAVDLADYDEATAADADGKQRTFNVTKSSDGYSMVDAERGIKIFDVSESFNGNPATSPNNSWSNSKLVSCAANIKDVYDFYRNTLKASAFRKNYLSNIEVEACAPTSDEGEPSANARCVTSGDLSSAIIRLSNSEGYTDSDIMMHEFTHSVIRTSCGLNGQNESGAIAEAYCNIMGVLFKGIQENDSDWKYGAKTSWGPISNLASPNRSRQPSNISDSRKQAYCNELHDHTMAGCDHGGIHKNAGIVGHAAYVMYRNGMSDLNELAKVFAYSMNYMVPSSDFKTCRAAVLHAAKKLGLSNDKLLIISNAFKDVGIENNTSFAAESSDNTPQNTEAPDGHGSLTGKVAAAGSMNPLPSAHVNSSAIDGNNNSQSSLTDEGGCFTQSLASGMYRINVALDGYRTCVINNVQIDSNQTTYLENTILLTEVSGDPLSKVGGRVVNAVSGDPVRGAVIRFLEEWGNITDHYVRNEQGNIIELLTDDDGRYYTDELPYGYYTGEITMPGYAKQYVNIIASTEESISSGQDVVLAPEVSDGNYRITLEWDSLPQDEDAHIKGDTPINFHVYYSDKTASYNGENIATLDHDDTEGNGFETITLTADESGTYKYFVHNYSGDGNLSNSNAKVKVYRNEVMVAQYNVPTDRTGEYWNVFEISGGEIITINEMTNTEP